MQTRCYNVQLSGSDRVIQVGSNYVKSSTDQENVIISSYETDIIPSITGRRTILALFTEPFPSVRPASPPFILQRTWCPQKLMQKAPDPGSSYATLIFLRNKVLRREELWGLQTISLLPSVFQVAKTEGLLGCASHRRIFNEEQTQDRVN